MYDYALEITLRCKDERRKCFGLYRRFDSYEQAIFVVADEVSEEWPEPAQSLPLRVSPDGGG